MPARADSALNLDRVPRHKLAETVAGQLVDQIREQHLAPGTKLPSERELQVALGVGRSTVREALKGLSLMGVLEIRHGSGVFVAEPASRPGPEQLAVALAKGVTEELFEARRIVEPQAARLAAERRTPAEVAELEQIIEEHRALVAAGELAVGPSVRFHLKVAEAAHNDVLESFVASFCDQLSARGPILEEVAGFQAWEVGQHERVLAPIREGKPQLAAKRMLAHLDDVIVYHERIGFDT